MNKIGVNLKLDVTKLDKDKFFVGKKGTYVDLVVFIDADNPSQFGDHGIIKQQADKGVDMPIAGNATVFWKEGQEQVQQQGMQQAQDAFEDDPIPF